MRRRTDRAQQDCFFNSESFVEFQKADAVFGRADAELGALLTNLLRCGLTRVRPAGEPLVARVVALVIGRYSSRIIIAPNQPGALALLLDVPADELGAARGNDPWIFVAIACRHQRSRRLGSGPLVGGSSQRFAIQRHQLPDTIRPALAAEQPAHPQITGLARGFVTAAGRPKRRVRLLHRLWQDLASRDLVVGPVIRDFLLCPD